ncbi:hypothetical protein P4S91_10115 [Aneurinibacillus aneurinilyticus]|jgi:hypothetical protein|uniref:hypothetical protein n=1 Tax=Aneurinibacillus aneurinilyticus TaxID=1391 RepID=UPI0023EFFF6B|nr:hypothetical protein [Aneurinibacillus aneurinilyticus]MCI1693570.1 hypothetical protein [Aneurinibacillus aneurinilyticus]MED0706088.1 hypothetical protein [Aneurinibacillus aneurinilyticus]MED0723269.1 hypothetical protein [Aneurinibacillus aneurinilyticus]MED0732662.1 hypothetical protein [Aneurinibacillus aneurinilyticus]MED0739799.1 hypothetical protein [Aneurinibacillus aneurinilyticus]
MYKVLVRFTPVDCPKRKRPPQQETNRRPFGARCGGDPLWIILDNQHPCSDATKGTEVIAALSAESKAKIDE